MFSPFYLSDRVDMYRAPLGPWWCTFAYPHNRVNSRSMEIVPCAQHTLATRLLLRKKLFLWDVVLVLMDGVLLSEGRKP